MDRKTFDECLARLGPDLGLWPERQRGEAKRLLVDDPDAAAHLDADRSMADLLVRAVASPGDEAATLSAVTRRIREGGHDAWGSRLADTTAHWLSPGAVATAMLIFAVLASGSGYGLAILGHDGDDGLLLAIADGGFIADGAADGPYSFEDSPALGERGI